MRGPTLCVLAMFWVACSTGTGAERPDRARGEVTAYTWVDWGALQYAEGYRVINNTWNKRAAAGRRYRQAVFLETLGGAPAFGWQWEWPAGAAVVAAPEIKFGDNPWDTPSGVVTGLPMTPGSAEVVADFDVRLVAEGVYNMAFDIWAVSALPPAPRNLSHEIMIWTMTHGLAPAGSLQGTHDVDGILFDLYVKPGHGDGTTPAQWTYVAFVPHGGDTAPAILRGPLRLSAFFELLLELGIVSGTTWLPSVEFLNEVVTGWGVAEVTGYGITVTPR